MDEFKQLIHSAQQRRNQRRRRQVRREDLEAYSSEIYEAIEAGYSLLSIHEALTIHLEQEGKKRCSLATLSRFVKERRPDLSVKFISPNRVGGGTRKKHKQKQDLAPASHEANPQPRGHNKNDSHPESDQSVLSISEPEKPNRIRSEPSQPEKQPISQEPASAKAEDSGATAAKAKPEKKVEVKTAPGRRKRWEDMTDEEQDAEIAEDIKRLQNPLKYMNGGPTDE